MNITYKDFCINTSPWKSYLASKHLLIHQNQKLLALVSNINTDNL